MNLDKLHAELEHLRKLALGEVVYYAFPRPDGKVDYIKRDKTGDEQMTKAQFMKLADDPEIECYTVKSSRRNKEKITCIQPTSDTSNMRFVTDVVDLNMAVVEPKHESADERLRNLRACIARDFPPEITPLF